MKEDTVILVVDEDGDCFKLIENNLRRSGILNEIKHFVDSGGLWSFLDTAGIKGNKTSCFVLILECDDGADVLKKIKTNKTLEMMPVVLCGSSDDDGHIKDFYELGCCCYIVKPTDEDEFGEVIRKTGMFISVIEVPQLVLGR